jgi:oxygen-independent coproporphyrinogen-3 oxidase
VLTHGNSFYFSHMHLYLHIPFCRQACHYCDFHFSTSLKNKRELVEAIAREIIQRKHYLPGDHLETIYFGGGTPSLLEESELHLLLDTIHTHFTVDPNAEITLEANPDDLTSAKLIQLAAAGINRLSIGIQSFDPDHLRYLHRVHTATEADNCVKMAQDIGIEAISIDLIYAIPAENHLILENDIQKAISLNVPHLSAYCLTIEPQTVFGKWLKNKKILPIEDEFAARQFELVVQQLGQHGYEQYEISNFARNGRYSRHNTAYWQRKPYLGVGPSAHSYNGVSRQYAVSNNAGYLSSSQKGAIDFTIEQLSAFDQVNEYLLTGLRTKWGCQLSLLGELSSNLFLKTHQKTIDSLVQKDWLISSNDRLLLTAQGKLFADHITAALFVD